MPDAVDAEVTSALLGLHTKSDAEIGTAPGLLTISRRFRLVCREKTELKIYPVQKPNETKLLR